MMTARERAKNAKWRAIETLDQQLEEFEMQLYKTWRQSNMGGNGRTGAKK